MVALLIFAALRGMWRTEKQFATNLRPWARHAKTILLVVFVILAILALRERVKGQIPNNVYDIRGPVTHQAHHNGWIYMNRTRIVYLADRNGEIHAFVSYLERINPATREVQCQLENGRWVNPN